MTCLQENMIDRHPANRITAKSDVSLPSIPEAELAQLERRVLAEKLHFSVFSKL